MTKHENSGLFTFWLAALSALALLTTGCQSGASVIQEVASDSSSDNASVINEASPVEYRQGDTRSVNIPGTNVSFSLVFVESGSFLMGSPEEETNRDEDEGPQKEIHVDGYWIGQYEVTDDEYAVFRYADRDADTTAVPGAVYSVDGVSRPSPPYEDPAFGMGGSGKPAVGMTQWGALHFAKWMSDKTGVFFRLPTEAEWEKACLADADGGLSQLPDHAWFDENSDYELQDVGQKEPNNWMIFDMLGNASEWTLDEYTPNYFEEAAASNPWIEPTRLHPRTVRGGAFDDPVSELRCGARLESTLNWKRRDPQIPKSFWWNTDSPFLGFRLVSPLTPPSAEEQELFWMMVLGE